MKYPKGCEVRVPYLGMDDNGETTRNWATLKFWGGPVDRRRVKRELRRWVRAALGRSLSQVEQRMILRYMVTAY